MYLLVFKHIRMKKLRNDVRNKKETLQKLIENYENGILPIINFIQIISYHNKPMLYNIPESIVVYLTSSCINWVFFWHKWASLKRE
jgi:hypothetical protein